MKVTIEGQELVIRIPARLKDPPRSASGKTLLVASETDKNTVQVLGKGLTVAINAYIKA
jgi:hypothetical protein